MKHLRAVSSDTITMTLPLQKLLGLEWTRLSPLTFNSREVNLGEGSPLGDSHVPLVQNTGSLFSGRQLTMQLQTR